MTKGGVRTPRTPPLDPRLMYVCMYTYRPYVCMYVCVYVLCIMYVCTLTDRMYVCMYVIMYTLTDRMYECMYVCMCVCMLYVCMCVCMYVCMYYVCIILLTSASWKAPSVSVPPPVYRILPSSSSSNEHLL